MVERVGIGKHRNRGERQRQQSQVFPFQLAFPGEVAGHHGHHQQSDVAEIKGAGVIERLDSEYLRKLDRGDCGARKTCHDPELTLGVGSSGLLPWRGRIRPQPRSGRIGLATRELRRSLVEASHALGGDQKSLVGCQARVTEISDLVSQTALKFVVVDLLAPLADQRFEFSVDPCMLTTGSPA